MLNKPKSFKTTLLRGVLFLTPFIVLIILLGKLFQITAKIIRPFLKLFPNQSIGGVPLHTIIIILFLILIFWLAGIISQSKPSKKIAAQLEDHILNKLPGYSFIKNVSEEFVSDNKKQEVVLVQLDDCWLLGFKMDEIENNMVAVYLPDSPSPLSGTVTIVEKKRVKPLNISQQDAWQIAAHMGKGISKINIPKNE